MSSKHSVPKVMIKKIEPIIKEIEVFCDENLNDNFKEKAIELTSKLSRKRPSPLNTGRSKTWSAAILDTIMKVNFVHDKSNPLHMTKKEFIQKIGVSQGTINKKSKEIMDFLDISILSQEWFVEGNEMHTMGSFLEDLSKSILGIDDISLLLEDDEYEELVVDEEIFQIIKSENIDELNEEELENFVGLCTNTICIMMDIIRVGFDDEDRYYESLGKGQAILIKANDAALKLYEKNKSKLKPYFDVHYMMAEMSMEGNDFESALEQYEHIRKQCPNYVQGLENKIFNLRLYMGDDVEAYLKHFDKENGAQWYYNRALYYYSIDNELMATKYLREAIRKNSIIAEALLENVDINMNVELSEEEREAVNYYISSKWIWMEIQDALEWIFYKR
ncbi:MAG: DUF6398 domain-containing protein [Romboutsia sp.]